MELAHCGPIKVRVKLGIVHHAKYTENLKCITTAPDIVRNEQQKEKSRHYTKFRWRDSRVPAFHAALYGTRQKPIWKIGLGFFAVGRQAGNCTGIH